MSFGTLAVRNLVRQRTRTVLTLLGIAIGITTVVALGVITGGMRGAIGATVHTGGAPTRTPSPPRSSATSRRSRP